MANPIRDWLDATIDAYEGWGKALRDPRSTAKRILLLPDRRQRIRAVTELWFASTLLSIIILLPVLYGYGIKLENLSFHVCTVTSQYAILVMLAWLLHLGLRIFKIPSRMQDTFVVYTVAVSAVGPLLSFFAIPSLRRVLAVIREIKKADLPILDSAGAIAKAFLTSSNDGWALAAAMLEPFGYVIGFFAMSMFVQLIVERYKVDTLRVIRAVAFASVVLVPLPALAIMVFSFCVMFIFVVVS
jgi:hypothetical protein